MPEGIIEEPRIPIPKDGERLQVGNLTIVFFPHEHTMNLNDATPEVVNLKETFEAHMQAPENAGAIFEYFPHELSDRAQQAGGGSVEFFQPLADILARLGKEAYVVDPAFDWTYFISMHPPAQVTVLGSLFLTGVGINAALQRGGMIEPESRPAEKPKPMTRLDLFKIAGLSLSTLLGMKAVVSMLGHVEKEKEQGRTIESVLNPQENRRIAIAWAITQLGKRPELAGKSLVLIYPPVHCQGIVRLLHDPELDKKFAALRLRVPPVVEQHVLSTRRYKMIDGLWVQQEKTPYSHE